MRILPEGREALRSRFPRRACSTQPNWPTVTCTAARTEARQPSDRRRRRPKWQTFTRTADALAGATANGSATGPLSKLTRSEGAPPPKIGAAPPQFPGLGMTLWDGPPGPHQGRGPASGSLPTNGTPPSLPWVDLSARCSTSAQAEPRGSPIGSLERRRRLLSQRRACVGTAARLRNAAHRATS